MDILPTFLDYGLPSPCLKMLWSRGDNSHRTPSSLIWQSHHSKFVLVVLCVHVCVCVCKVPQLVTCRARTRHGGNRNLRQATDTPFISPAVVAMFSRPRRALLHTRARKPFPSRGRVTLEDAQLRPAQHQGPLPFEGKGRALSLAMARHIRRLFKQRLPYGLYLLLAPFVHG